GGATPRGFPPSGAGSLSPPEPPAPLLAAVRKLVDGPAEADTLGARGPEYVARHLSREAGLARFDALLTEVLADAQGRPHR
ncbi:glycosyltransferase WbuB, partial [Streptomyces sp. NPDC057460]